MDEIIVSSQQFKLRFSRIIGVNWKILGRWLSIEDNYLDTIEKDYNGTENQGYEMLKKWTNRSDEATLDVLIAALINMERIDLINELEKLKDLHMIEVIFKPHSSELKKDIPDDYNFQKLLYECFYESQSSIIDEIKSFVDERRWMISIDDGKTSYETSCESYFVNNFIKSGRMLTRLDVRKNVLNDDEKHLIIKCSTNVRYVWFYHPFKFDRWQPKDKIECLTIYIPKYLISKKDFEECFLPWMNICKELSLYLNKNIDFIEDIYKWIFVLNIKEFFIKYRGKDFRNLEDLKNFLTNTEKS